MHQRILILDYGSQVTQLIARRVREAGVYCELHPGDVDAAFCIISVPWDSRALSCRVVMLQSTTRTP